MENAVIMSPESEQTQKHKKLIGNMNVLTFSQLTPNASSLISKIFQSEHFLFIAKNGHFPPQQ